MLAKVVRWGLLIVVYTVGVVSTAQGQASAIHDNNVVSQRQIQARKYLQQANKLVEAQHYAEAVPVYQKALTLEPNLASAQNNLGHAYTQLARFQEAVSCLERAVDLEPTNPVFRHNLGNTYLQFQSLDKAIEQLTKAMELSNDFPQAYNDLGNAYLEQLQYERAIGLFQRAIALRPDFSTAYNNLGTAYYASTLARRISVSIVLRKLSNRSKPLCVFGLMILEHITT